MALTLDCSLANAAAIATPTVGTGAGAFASPSTTFSGGHAIMTAKEDVIQFRQTDGVTANVNLARGRYRIRLNPTVLSSSNYKLAHGSIGTWRGPASVNLLEWGRMNQSNQHNYRVIYFDAEGIRHEHAYPKTAWAPLFVKGTWIDTFDLSWDWTVEPDVPNLQLSAGGIIIPPSLYWISGVPQMPPMRGPKS